MSENPVQSTVNQDDSVPVSRAEFNALLKRLNESEQKREAAEQARAAAEAKAKAFVTTAVAHHGGGPGTDNHRESWTLAEQEAAKRGDWLDHWGDKPEDWN